MHEHRHRAALPISIYNRKTANEIGIFADYGNRLKLPTSAPNIVPLRGNLLKFFNQLLRNSSRATVIRVDYVVGNFAVVFISLQHERSQYFLRITILQ
jgi:hypothetical protein